MKDMESKMKDQFLDLWTRNFIFCDVGARWGLEEPWKSYRDCINVVSFEPDREEYEELSNNKFDRDSVFCYALYNEQKKLNLNLTKSRGCSSIFQPNYSFLQQFPDVDRFTVEAIEMVESTTLDILFGKKVLSNLDFIKLDTQGAELDILMGGVKLLNETVLAVQVEVYFKQVYTEQVLFSDVDIFIREKLDLELIDIRKSFWKYKEGQRIGPSKGQLMVGDALYFRDPYQLLIWCEQFNKEEARNKIFMACFIAVLYGYPDYSLCVLAQPQISQWIKTERIERLKKIIIAYARCIHYYGKGCGKIWKLFYLMSKIFESNYEGWHSLERHLGSRKKFGVFW